MQWIGVEYSIVLSGIVLYWVAVKELDLSNHSMNMYKIIWFLDSGNLN